MCGRCLVLLLLLLTPVCGNRQRYVLLTGPNSRNWTDAQAYCRTHHTDLVTISDATENEDYFEGKGWIGLYREDVWSPWKWSRGDKIATFIHWEYNPHSPGNCAFKHFDTEGWRVHECDVIHSFMCSNEKLFLVKENKTWEEALEHCRSLERLDPNVKTSPYRNYRYDLATLITPEDHASAREEAQKATTETVWTGLRYLAGQWMWVSGEPVTYKMIPDCPGINSCGALEKNGKEPFKLRQCNKRGNFFCSRRP